MPEISNIEYLVRDNNIYKERVALWQKAAEKVSKYFSEERLLGGEYYALPAVSTKTNPYEINMSVAGITLRCIFQFTGDKSALRFGYVKLKNDGREKFIETKRMTMDHLGNILEDGVDGAVYNLTQGSWLDGVLLAEFRKALEEAWSKI